MRAKLLFGAGVVGAALIVLGLLPLYGRVFGRKRLRFPYLARPIPAARYAELAGKPGWTKSEIDVAPGIKLRGLVRRPSETTAPWLLFYPGNDESQLERGQAFLIRLGSELPWGLAVFAYRGYDASDGKPSHDDMQRDAPRIVAELCRVEHLRPGQVHLAGFSIGGHFAAYAASATAAQGARTKSLTLLASVDDIVMYHPSPWEKLSAGEDYQTQPFLAGIPAPVLVLQGDADEALDGPGQGRAIAQTLGARAEYVELPGVKHVPLLENPTALERVRKFVTENSR
jgi:pimeloyl-ACP methyl ester carboxylesterase